MLVKDFVKVSTYDYANITLDGEFLEEYDRLNTKHLEYGEAEVIAINPIKSSGWLTGVELEIELPDSIPIVCPDCGKVYHITKEVYEEYAAQYCVKCNACIKWSDD